ncbi:MAG: septum formation initiator family protein [Holosporales bacterium]|jgi:cell division protein FtsB|nr:septum formation initiator family protein [Holosporales bacterium]
MNLSSKFSDNASLVLKVFPFALVFVYLLYHAFSGRNGMFSYVEIRKQLVRQSRKLNSIKVELDERKRDVNLLSNDSIDLDMLEERCRIVLNYSYPNETISTRD